MKTTASTIEALRTNLIALTSMCESINPAFPLGAGFAANLQDLTKSARAALALQPASRAVKAASVIPDEFAVRHSVRPDVGKEFLTWDVPNGWDDVKKLCKKVIKYDGRKFTFSCWNSDGLYIVFARGIDAEVLTATIAR